MTVFERVLMLAQQERERRQIKREQLAQQRDRDWQRVVGVLKRADQKAAQGWK